MVKVLLCKSRNEYIFCQLMQRRNTTGHCELPPDEYEQKCICYSHTS